MPTKCNKCGKTPEILIRIIRHDQFEDTYDLEEWWCRKCVRKSAHPDDEGKKDDS